MWLLLYEQMETFARVFNYMSEKKKNIQNWARILVGTFHFH